MDSIFKIDGRSFSGVGVERLKRRFWVTDGPAAGVMLSGDQERDLQGTYYGYDLLISAENLTQNEYDDLFEILSAPADSHEVEMPYGSTTITFKAMIYSGYDDLISMDDGTWWGNLAISIKSKAPVRIPD